MCDFLSEEISGAVVCPGPSSFWVHNTDSLVKN